NRTQPTNAPPPKPVKAVKLPGVASVGRLVTCWPSVSDVLPKVRTLAEPPGPAPTSRLTGSNSLELAVTAPAWKTATLPPPVKLDPKLAVNCTFGVISLS